MKIVLAILLFPMIFLWWIIKAVWWLVKVTVVAFFVTVLGIFFVSKV